MFKGERRIYFPYDHYNPIYRGELLDLLKPFVGKDNSFTDFERVNDYGLSINDFVFIENIELSDWVILPMSWNYYIITDKFHLANDLIDLAYSAGKIVLSWISGDFGVSIPDYANLIVLRQSGYRSKLSHKYMGLPVFMEDPYRRFLYAKSDISGIRNIPVVGFCGQADGDFFSYSKETFRTLGRNLLYYLNLSKNEPQSIVSSTYRRSRALLYLSDTQDLRSNFIKRRKYRAGAHGNIERESTTREYFENMISSDYILCIRGGGNFSVRFYETLAMGRIPVFVNTDCILPFADQIDWKRHVVWVEENEIKDIGRKVLEFHQRLSPEEFLRLKMVNRKLWEEYLRFGGFWKRIFDVI